MSLRTAYAELLALLPDADLESEKAEDARRKMLRRSKVRTETRDAIETNLYDARQRVKRIRREIARIEVIYARIEAERQAGKSAKLAAEEVRRREFRRARSARRQERKRLATD